MVFFHSYVSLPEGTIRNREKIVLFSMGHFSVRYLYGYNIGRVTINHEP